MIRKGNHSMKTIFRDSIPGLLLILLLLALFALPPTVRALLPPPAPDGGYPGGNTAEGSDALFSLTSGSFNTATGVFALSENTTGHNNTANGAGALEGNTTGNLNTANGSSALESNTTGSNNTADGNEALKNNTTANNNTADGFQALFHNITGAGNTAIGFHALLNNKGSSNIALGLNAGVSLTIGSNNIDIGSFGAAGESNTIRIGSAQVRTFIKGISGAVVSGAPVVVNAGGQLGVAASSERFKDEIKPMEKASEVILALKPVTFRYKKEIDPDSTPQFGLLAEEVEKVNPALVTRDADGKVYTVRYEQVNAMLLNEFLKEHRRVERQECKIQEQETTIAQLKREMETVVTHAKEQDANIQRVNEQLAAASPSRGGLEASKTAPQMVLNNP
jgi:Chaperone of endosialidase